MCKKKCNSILFLILFFLFASRKDAYSINKSVHLNAGSNTNYITINNSGSGSGSVFDFGNDTFTIEAWVRPVQFSIGNNSYEHTIIGNDNQSGIGSGYVLRTGSNKKVEFAYKTTTGWNVVSTPNVIFDFEKWVHVAVSKQGAHVSIYINGSMVKDSTFTSATISSSTSPVRIGENGSLNGRRFRGKIDEVKIWSMARNAIDVKEDMAESCPPYSNKLLAYYKMNDTGTIAPTLIVCHTNTTYNGALNDTVNSQTGALLIKGYTTLYVDSSNTNTSCGCNAGYSWNTAFKDLNDAILVGQTYPFIEKILIAKGTYVPNLYRFDMKPSRSGQQITSTDNEDKLFHVRSGIEIYGGYPSGGGPRNPYTNPTILDGKGVGGISNDTAYHVICTDSSDYWGTINDTTLIDGLIIRRSRTKGNSSLIYASIVRGGAVYLMNGTNILTNCTVEKSYGYNGVSGIYSNKGHDLIKNCKIQDNTEGYAFSGEYYSNNYFRRATLLNDTFINNNSGAIHIESNTRVLNSYITNNVASSTPGIRVSGSYHTIKNNLITYNKTTAYSTLTGGGMSFSQTYTDSVLDNQIIGNYCAASQGGGIFFFGGDGHFVAGNLIANDTARLGGGICAQNTNIACHNNIIKNNCALISGAGIYSGLGYTNLEYNIIINNISKQSAGGIHLFGTGAYIKGNTINNNSDSLFCGGLSFSSDTVQMYNNVISNNKSGSYAGIFADTKKLIFCNNTVYGNSVLNLLFWPRGGGLYISQRGFQYIYNNIFWNNKLISSNVQGADIYLENNVRTFKNNILQLPATSYTTTGTGSYDLGVNASGNIFSQYPAFADTINIAGNDNTFNTADDGLQVTTISPAINSGDSSLLSDPIFYDIIGIDRIVGANIDIGAYEKSCTPVNISKYNATHICSGNSTILTIGTPLPASTVNWYADSISTTVIDTGYQYQTPLLYTTDTVWVSVTGCSNSRTPIIIYVNNNPSTLANTTLTSSICKDSSTVLSVFSNIIQERIYWYADNSLSVLLDSGTRYSTPFLSATDTFWAVAKGCIDTVSIPIIVSIYPSTGSKTVIAACDSFYWINSNQQYYATGMYYDTTFNTYGCLQIDTLNLTVNNKPTAIITQNANVLSALPAAANAYQWINCSNNNPIPNATNQVYTATVNGKYAVIVTVNDCSDTSACTEVKGLSVEQFKGQTPVVVSPNPTNAFVYIHTSTATPVGIQMYNILGLKVTEVLPVHNTTSIFVGNLPKGIYTIHIKFEKETIVRKLTID